MSDSTISSLGDQAFELFNQGNLQGAKALYEKINSLDAKNAEAQMMLGVIKADSGDIAGAEVLLRRALEISPDYADVYFYFGHIQQAKGNLPEAVHNLERALELDSAFDEARELLNKLLSDLANNLLQQGQLQKSIEYFKKLNHYQPENIPAWFMLAKIYAQLGDFSQAEQCGLEVVRLDAKIPDAFILLASVLLAQGKLEQANRYSEQALQLDANNINAIALGANIAKHMGDVEKADALLSPLLAQGVEQINIALAFAMISKDVGKQQQAISLMEKILNTDHSINAAAKSNLCFNLGMLYDNINQFDKAFYYYQQGNNLKPFKFDQAEHKRLIEKYISVYSADFMAQQPRSSIDSERPVFVVGMVRSGTSLVEQILSSHAQIYGAGELGDMYQFSKELPNLLNTNTAYPECLSQLTQQQTDKLTQRYLDHLNSLSADEKRVVDKLPGNFMHLGLIELLFPGARIIHCMRNPIDTCLSTYFQDFSTPHPYAYEQSNLGEYYNDYLKLMAHWRKVLKIPMLELNYEDLINDQQRVSEELIAFCGLQWDPACLSFYENKRIVRTASYDQVNRPLHNKSVARWKNYESHLGVLLQTIDK